MCHSNNCGTATALWVGQVVNISIFFNILKQEADEIRLFTIRRNIEWNKEVLKIKCN